MKLVSRRSFLKLAGVTALAVVGASALSGCGADQILVPLRFDSNVIGAETAQALDEAKLKVVYTTDKGVLTKEILAAVKGATKTVNALGRLNVNELTILDPEVQHDYTEGQDSIYLYVTFVPAMQ